MWSVDGSESQSPSRGLVVLVYCLRCDKSSSGEWGVGSGVEDGRQKAALPWAVLSGLESRSHLDLRGGRGAESQRFTEIQTAAGWRMNVRSDNSSDPFRHHIHLHWTGFNVRFTGYSGQDRTYGVTVYVRGRPPAAPHLPLYKRAAALFHVSFACFG